MNPHSFSKRFVIAGLPALVLLLAMAPSGWRDGRDGGQDASAERPAALRGHQRAATQRAHGQLEQRGADDSLMAALQAARARVEPVEALPTEAPDASYRAANPWQRLRAYFAADSVQVVPGTAGGDLTRWRARLSVYGRGRSLRPVLPANPVAKDNRVEYVRGSVTEWYINDARGLEQGFTLAAPPADYERRGGLLVLRMAVETDLEPRLSPQGDSIQFVSSDGEVRLHYAGLKSWDASGTELPARMEVSEGQIALVVDDRGATYPVTVDPQIFSEAKLTASDAGTSDLFGFSVAISGDTAVVGAPQDSDAGPASGSAYVFVRSGSLWTQQAKLTASDAAGDDVFGGSVAVSGDTAVVGARFDDTDAGDDSGSAYVFVRSGSVWTQQAKLTASDAAAFDQFGYSVAISVDTAVVGSPGDDDAGDLSGSAYVFVRSGSNWAEQAKLTASDAAAGDNFGISVAISGDTAVVGAFGDNTDAGDLSGSAYVFVRPGSNWAEQAKLTASDAAASDSFGYSVAIDGDTAVVGAPNDSDAGYKSGSAYAFARSGSSWTEQAKLTAPDAAEFDEFGTSVAVSDDTAVVGAFGDSDAGNSSGSAYVFVRSGSSWTEQAKLTASDAAANDQFGFSVAISGDTAVAGAPNDNEAAFAAGAAYVLVNVTEADLLVSLDADRPTVRQGNLLTYTITVRNLGPNRAVNAVVEDVLSSGTTFVSASADHGGFTGPPPGQTGTVTWYPGDLPSGDQEAAQIRVTVIVRGRTTITNTATVSSETFDANPANNSASITVRVVPGGRR